MCPKVGGCPALMLYLSNEPGELLQWLCHVDSTVSVVVTTNVAVAITAVHLDCR